MSKFKVGDTVKVLSHKNKEMIGKVSTITEVLKDSKGVYLYKVKGIKNYATEKDIERKISMKKIMYSDRYGLTEAVLSGQKTMTRRIIKCPGSFNGIEVCGFHKYTNKKGEWYTALYDEDERDIDNSCLCPKYDIGEKVAIAQSYNVIFDEMNTGKYNYDLYENYRQLAMGMDLAGNKNKMFVRADLMPHHIKITNVFPQHLLDISYDDCIKEGINYLDDMGYTVANEVFHTPKEAFAYLINKICGKDTWELNPWVGAYEFKLED